MIEKILTVCFRVNEILSTMQVTFGTEKLSLTQFFGPDIVYI